MPPGQDPLVAGHDVRVRPDDDADPPVEVQPERVLLGRELAVEVDQPDRRQRLGTPRRAGVGVGERVLDRLHVRAALEVDHGDVASRRARRTRPNRVPGRRACRSCAAAARDRRLEERIDLALVPDVVAARDDVDARRQHRVGGRRREAHAAGHVLAVGGHEVDAARLAQAGQDCSTATRPGLPIRSPIIRTRQAPAAAAHCRWPGYRGASARWAVLPPGQSTAR